MRFDIITIFPNLFSSYLEETIIARAIRKKLLRVNLVDLRKFAKAGDSHRSVDGRPYGGGPGMILLVEPIYKALRSLRIKNYELRILKKKKNNPQFAIRNPRIIQLSPEGKPFTQREAERFAKYDRLVLLCGRYAGFDGRVDNLIDEKISIGPYVLAGGELPAMVVLETVARHIPGVVGHADALKEETFSKDLEYVEYPQYTRPEVFYPTPPYPPLRRGGKKRGGRGPKGLLSGNHGEISVWRKQHRASR